MRIIITITIIAMSTIRGRRAHRGRCRGRVVDRRERGVVVVCGSQGVREAAGVAPGQILKGHSGGQRVLQLLAFPATTRVS